MIAPDLSASPPPLPSLPVAGRWLIETQWLPDDAGSLSHVTTLYAVVPKCPPANRYRLAADGFRDPLYYGDRIEMEFDARRAVAGSAGWDDTRALDRGDCYWVSLSRAAGPAAQAEAARTWLQLRFAGLRIAVQPLGVAAAKVVQ